MKFVFGFLLFFVCIHLHGQNWSPLASGVGFYGAKNMYADSSFLYVTGNFAQVGGHPIKGIARWNGFIWDSLGAGVDGLDTANQWPSGDIVTMVNFNNELYVGGGFKSLGSVSAKGFGKWNGTAWDTIAIQPEGAAKLEVIDHELYLTGGFDSLAGIPANSLGKWDGTNWHNLGFPNFYLFPFIETYASITSLCKYQGKLYVAGNFESYPFGTDTVGNILCYDGINWTSVGGGVKGGSAGIWDMVVYHDELYVGGYFFRSDGNPGEYIQKWNGSFWTDVGGGTGNSNGSIYKLIVWHDKLYTVGVLESAGGVPADRIAVWDGVKWCGLGSTFDNIITTAAIFHDSLFVGGGFRIIDGDTMNYIAKWKGGNFTDTCSAIGIDKRDILESEFYYYPNPSSSLIKINFPALTRPFVFTISDVFGKTLTEKNLSSQTLRKELDISELAAGIYFITLESESGSVTKKFIKQ